MILLPRIGVEDWDLPEGGRDYHAHCVIKDQVYGYTHRVSEQEIEAFGGDPKFFTTIQRSVIHQFIDYLISEDLLETVDLKDTSL